MTMSPETVFGLLLLGTVLWIMIPFVPAPLEATSAPLACTQRCTVLPSPSVTLPMPSTAR